MLETIGELGPWVLSSVALIQVWAIALWRKYRKGRVEIHESGTIELGYGTFGPSVALMGTLQAQHKDVFVKRATVTVVRLSDGSTHQLNWRAFRPRTISLAGHDNQELELPSSFLIQPAEPFRYNIVFVDDEFIAAHKDGVDPIQKEWYEFKQEQLGELEAQNGEGVKAVAEDPRTMEGLFSEFSKTPEVVQAYSVLDRAFYWDPGEYSLSMSIECGEPDKTFTKNWYFTITDHDARTLRLNSVATIRAICGLNSYFGFAYAEYKPRDLALPTSGISRSE